MMGAKESLEQMTLVGHQVLSLVLAGEVSPTLTLTMLNPFQYLRGLLHLLYMDQELVMV
jgi:hypothetical protein